MKYDEYQGFDSLFAAEITKDEEGENGYVVETPFMLAPAGEISVPATGESTSKYYNNIPYLNITAEGANEVSLTTPILPLEIKTKLTGKDYDKETGAELDSGQPITKYFALLYRLRFTDGSYRYVVRHKGSFRIGDESAKSQDATTDSTNQSLTFTSITTSHKFTKTKKPSKMITVDERDKKCDVSTWFEEVVTPDNIKALPAA